MDGALTPRDHGVCQVATLFDVRLFSRGEVIFRMGDPGDRMYIVLWGHVQIWTHEKTREEKRKDRERNKLKQEMAERAARLAKGGIMGEEEEEEERAAQAALREPRPVIKEKRLVEYRGGTDNFPWFGEVLQWVNDHGRAGDGLR